MTKSLDAFLGYCTAAPAVPPLMIHLLVYRTGSQVWFGSVCFYGQSDLAIVFALLLVYPKKTVKKYQAVSLKGNKGSFFLVGPELNIETIAEF